MLTVKISLHRVCAERDENSQIYTFNYITDNTLIFFFCLYSPNHPNRFGHCAQLLSLCITTSILLRSVFIKSNGQAVIPDMSLTLAVFLWLIRPLVLLQKAGAGEVGAEHRRVNPTAGHLLTLCVEDVFFSLLQPRQCYSLQEKKSSFLLQRSPHTVG